MTEVLICGAGPTGLTMALLLLKHHIPVRIIDQKKGHSTHSKALALHARTLELLERIGLVQAFLKRGIICDHLTFHHDHETVKVSLSGIDSPYPYVLIVPQSITEELLYEEVLKAGGKVHWETELIRLNDKSATLLSKGTEETMDYSWILGCDGAHSTIRHASGIPFIGAPLDETFLIADISAQSTVSRDSPNGFFNPSGIALTLPLPADHQYRLIFPLSSQEGVEEPSETLLKSLMKKTEISNLFKIDETLWISKFHIHRRLATRFKQGHTFLIGDAAHIHSPAGGQGLNTSLQDAANLAWKLALAIGGRASSKLLDTYEDERKPIAAEVLNNTTRLTLFLSFFHKRHWGWLLKNVLRLLNINPIRLHIAQTLSETNVRYHSSPLSTQPLRDMFWGGPQPGDRAPDAPLHEKRLFECLDPTKFTLVLFDASHLGTIERIKMRYQDWIQVVVIDSEEGRKKYAAGPLGVYLLRPDGYIGYRSQRYNEDEVLQALLTYTV